MKKNKKVLITGVAGFLGTHVAEFFRKKDWDVVGIDNLTDFELKRTDFDVEKSREHNLKFLESIGVEFRNKDCREIVSGMFNEIDFIIHCAAQPAMTISLEDPYHDASNNVMGCVNMLEIARKEKIPFINCSSIHIYGNDGNKDLIERKSRFVKKYPPHEINEKTEILKGDLTPLHASKRATELYTQSFSESYGIRTASFRLTGMYGERQFGGMDHGWVANFAIRTIMERDITVFETYKQVRDILYAEDAARAFLMWYKKGSSGIFNIGGGIKNSISLGECIDVISKVTRITPNVEIGKKRFGDLHYFVCDYKKAFDDFGWKPKISPKEGIPKLIKWINENKEIL